MILELEENEVKNILDTLIEENIIIQNDDTYFYSKTKNKKTIQYSKNDYVEEIVLEELEGYDEYLKLKPCYKKTVDKKVKLIKLIHNLLGDDFKRTLDLYNAQNPNDTVGYSTATVYRNQFRNYGLRGLFPKIRGPKDSAAVDTIYETFKKYYLNTNKFSTEIALKLAQNELQNDGKIAFPLVHNAKSFYNKLIKELGKPSIEHLRNTAEFIIPDENKEVVTPSYKVVDITFKEAAANYLKNLSKLKKEERLLSEKTSYKNQIAYYFDDYKINEITPDVLREYKQEKYNSGYSVSSVKTYLTLVKSIITHACPYKEQMAKQLEILSAIDMNILDKSQIEKLLSLAKREFKWGYPIIRLGLLSGANVPEILALQWENVFFSEKRIHISKFLHSGKIVKHRGNSIENFNKIKDVINAPDSDIFDVLTFIAYSENLQTRQERVDNHKVAIFNNIQSRQHAFIEFVLKQYIQNGVTELDNERIGDLINLKYGSPANAIQELGNINDIRATFCNFQKYLYKKA